MVRVYLKGGIWTNAEDEILKAAVQKYGKQHWARVASLLNKKTAKQAKARWLEWLDPSIRKTEWSRAEEEKLLHLSKLMPAQWKTIAPIVGRTATQCQEHYEALLDQAAAGSNQGGDSNNTDLRQQQQQLRPGQIDAHPESKPARPDPIDMDEDEMEMLQEARARLANTVGKKAKRKQRERMLAQAKRLADLQKRRELNQAGLLSTQRKKRRKEIDLGVEIPFYKPAPAGLHDTSSEIARTQRTLQQHLHQVDLKRVNESVFRTRDREAAAAAKKQESRMKVLEKSNEKYAAAARKQQEEAAAAAVSRGSLKLPAPVVKDDELSQLAKLQQQQQQHLVVGGGGSAVTQALLGDYSDRPLPTPMRGATPMMNAGRSTLSSSTTPLVSLMQQASQLRKLEQGQTPLLVGMGTGYDEDDEDDDRKQAAATPALPDRAGVGQTPSRKRDSLGLNIYADDGHDDAASLGASSFATRQSSIRELARQERRAAKKARLELEAALAALPAPQFEYELAAPEHLPEEGPDDVVVTVRDKADIEEAEQEALRKQAEKLYQARSSVLKRDDLPRPTGRHVSADLILEGGASSEAVALRLIQQEALTLIQHDAYAYPVLLVQDAISKKKKKRKQEDLVEEVDLPPPVALEYLPEDKLEQSKSWIQQESEILLEEKIALVVRDGKAGSRDEALELLMQERTHARLPVEESRLIYQDKKGWTEATSQADISASLRLELQALEEATESLRRKNEKLESKLGVIHGGYAKRAKSVKQDIFHAFDDTQSARIEEAVYSMLEGQEIQGGMNRVERLEGEIKSLRTAEAELQKRYGELLLEKRRAAVSAKHPSNGSN